MIAKINLLHSCVGKKIYKLSQGQISVCNLANVDQIIKDESESESGTFLFD